SENITESEDFIEFKDIIDSDTLDLDKDFISLPKNFSTHWTGFLQVTEVPTHKAVLVTDYFDKAILSSEKTNELHTLLLQALVYSNIPFTFAENPFFILFLKSL
ncbi:9163_t:CDS:2, partial [Cetraspora pellucida]